MVQSKRTHIVMPNNLVIEIDKIVGKRGRSQFVTQAAKKELDRLRMLKALDESAGSWKDADHPELKSGAAAWVRELRKTDEKLRRRKN